MDKYSLSRLRATLPQRHKLAGGLLLLLLFFPLAACSGMPQGKAADGERWYRLHRCDGCHGKDGKGGRGPVLAGTDLRFNRFVRIIRNPGSTVMPAYDAGQLPNEDVADIYLWLMTQEK
jgi:mono/diheme cytochrome c family protein